jgi:hypothetical protein
LVRVNRDLDSSETDLSDLHQGKRVEHRISTLYGIEIDRSAEYESVSDSVRVSREFDSNETEPSRSDRWKGRGERTGIEPSS